MHAARRTQVLVTILVASLPAALTHAQAPTPEAEDFFGWSLAAGDFNADGYADLAVGVPNQDVNGQANAGAVDIYYGTSTGFSAPQVWHQDTPGVPGGCEPGDQFGYRLATGDFNGDGVSDLAVGVPFEDFASGVVDDGGVLILYGKAQVGLAASGSQFWGQTSGLPFAAEAGDGFGEALVAGDFNGDRCDDLAVGVPREHIGNLADAGAVGIIFGSRATATAVNGLQKVSPAPQGWSQNSTGIAGTSDAYDQFGFSLAAADFNKDGYVDLAVGVPYERAASDGGILYADMYAGAVNLIYGSPSGLSETLKNDEILEPLALGTQPRAARFGAGLAAGDFDGNGTIELAVAGLRWESGSWQHPYWRGGGLWVVKVGAGSPLPLLAPPADTNDWNHGGPLASADVNADRRSDLAMQEMWGYIRVRHGNSAGLEQRNNRQGAHGSALAMGDFNGDGKADLAVGDRYATLGVPNTPSYARWVGAVRVLYGGQNGLSLAGSKRLMDAPCEFFEQAGDCNDIDRDGVPAGLERLAGTVDSVANDRDSDDDGIPDGTEIVGLKQASDGSYTADNRSNPAKKTLAVVLLYPPGVTGFNASTLKSKLESYFNPIAADLELIVLPKELTSANGTALNNSCAQTVASEGAAPGQQLGWIAGDVALGNYLGGATAGDGGVAVFAPYAHVARVCLDNDASTPVKGAIQYKGGWQFMVKMRSPAASWDAAQLEQWHRALASLTAHELGHSLGLGHGGDTDEDCSPLYPSVMNHMYDFQLGPDTGSLSFCNALGFSAGVLVSGSPLEIAIGQSEYDVLDGVTTKTGVPVTPSHLTFLSCLGRGDVASTVVTPSNPILTVCGTGANSAPIYCANWDQDEYFGAQEDGQTVGLYYALDDLYSPYSVLYARTGGVRPAQAHVSGCAESELYTTEADLQVLLKDHDDLAYILEPNTLWTTARHQGCGIRSCTEAEALVEPPSAGQLEAMRGWW